MASFTWNELLAKYSDKLKPGTSTQDAMADEEVEEALKAMEINDNGPDSPPTSPSLLSPEQKIIAPPATRKAPVDSDTPIKVKLSELYKSKAKIVVYHHTRCRYYWLSVQLSCIQPVKCPYCPDYVVYGKIAWQVADYNGAENFKDYMKVTELYQKIQSTLFIEVHKEQTYAQTVANKAHCQPELTGYNKQGITDGKLFEEWIKWFDVLPVPEIVGLHQNFRITKEWNFEPNMNEFFLWDKSNMFRN